MYGKLSITWLFWQLAILGTFVFCQLMNILLTQFWTGNLLVHKPTSYNQNWFGRYEIPVDFHLTPFHQIFRAAVLYWNLTTFWWQ